MRPEWSQQTEETASEHFFLNFNYLIKLQSDKKNKVTPIIDLLLYEQPENMVPIFLHHMWYCHKHQQLACVHHGAVSDLSHYEH